MTDEQRPDRDLEWPSEDLGQSGATPEPREDVAWPSQDQAVPSAAPPPAPPPQAPPHQAPPPPASAAEYDEHRPPPEPAHGIFTGPAPSLTPLDPGPYAIVAGPDTTEPEPTPEDKRRHYYRPDIEGLRAVAVIAVVLFHIGLPLTTGGFVGVDVFYVISGFLITGLLLREGAESGKIDLLRFYARRMRRLLPAALAVIVVTLAMSAVIVNPLRLTEIAGDAAAAALYVANFRFAIEATNYLAGEAQSPLLHYWTLGVEEQFYLVWPLILLVATRFLSLRLVGGFFLVLAIASFGLSLYWTEAAPAWAFFSPLTRAWELAAGALIAVGLLRIPKRAPGWTASILVVMGLALIVASVILLGDETPFPGVAAALPVLGAVFVIVGGVARPTLPGRVLLANPISRYVGHISYSLYLWHWPILILIPIAIGSNDLGLRIGLAGVAVAIAAISTEVIERPFRRSGFLAVRSRGSIQLGLSGSVAVGVVALVMSGAITIPTPWTRIDPIVVELAGVREDLPRSYADGCHLPFDATEPVDCVYGDTDGTRTAVLFGDSHAAQWLPALDDYAREKGWKLEVHTKSACSPVPAVLWERKLRRVYDECEEWRDAVIKRIATDAPEVVFVGSSREYELWDNGRAWQTNEVYPYWQGRLTALIRDLEGKARRVVLLAETPFLNFDPIDCLADESVSNCDPPKRLVVDGDYGALEAVAADAGGATLLSANELLCPGRTCPVVVDDVVVFRDRQHVTASYMEQLSEPLSNLLEGRAPYPTPSPSAGTKKESGG